MSLREIRQLNRRIIGSLQISSQACKNKKRDLAVTDAFKRVGGVRDSTSSRSSLFGGN